MSKEVFLKHPVTRQDGAKIDRVKFHRLKVKHLRELPESMFKGDGSDVRPQDMPQLLVAVTGLPQEVVDEIDMEDLTQLAEPMRDFLEASLGIGETQSQESPTTSDS
jgi:hypothetical protein